MARQRITKVQKPLFCGFVAKNSVPVRNNFVVALSKYKLVSCPGEILNNYPRIGGRMGQAKDKFLRCCKFTVAFENYSKRGYITEKILHAFQSRTIPIYWGSELVRKYFNPDAFINCNDYDSWDDVIAEIIRIDNDDTVYLNILNQPVFKDGLVSTQFWPDTVLTGIENMIQCLEYTKLYGKFLL